MSQGQVENRLMHIYIHIYVYVQPIAFNLCIYVYVQAERWGAGVETQKNVRGEIGGWGRVPFNEP